MLLIASVPTTATLPDAGLTATPMQMFIRPAECEICKVVVLIKARSWSGMSHPGLRPVKAAFVPRMNSVQSPWLSSIHRPPSFRFTIRLTRGGRLFVIRRFRAGLKFVPLFGGGFWPSDGAFGKLTGLGRGRPAEMPVPIIVEALPD